MDSMHQTGATACQSQSLLPPAAGAAGASPCFHGGVSLFAAAAAACLFLLAASSAIYCFGVAIVSSDKESRRRLILKLRGRNSKKQQHQESNAPPPPPGRGSGWWWSVAETLAFVAAHSSGRGFYHFVHARHRRYGPPGFRTALFGRTHVFVSSAGAARSLLAAEPAGFSKRYVRTVADLLGEHSLLCASHSAHRSLRRAVAPLFNARAAASFAAAFDALTRHLMLDWRATTTATATAVVLDGALGITFEAICDMLVATLPRDAKRRLQGDVLAVTRAMLAFPLRLPGTRFHAGLRARGRIMEVLRREIASRRRRSSNGSPERRGHGDMDFLQSLLLRSQQQSGSGSDEAPLTDEQILDNILTLIIAGQVTTAAAITWMVKYLADNRDFQETLRSVQLELAHKHQDSPLTLQHLSSMDLAYKAVKESLRMASIVSWFPRVALEDCQVAGFHINKGWIVNVDARSLHYDPTIYDNPTMFDPSRFDGEDMKQPYSYLVFGAGGRTCLGMNLAKIMMLIFLHRLVTNFRWEMADDDTSLEKWAMFPRLKNGCPIHLTPV